jgi:hypothetical protein
MNSIPFVISGLPLDEFNHLFEMSDAELEAVGARRCVADAKPGYPCRVSLEEAEIGEHVILVTYEHHPVDGPYRGSGPIYVREIAKQVQLGVNEIPDVARRRLMSVRAYDAQSLMVVSDVVEGVMLEQQIEKFFADPNVAYLHLHNAKPGCFSCRVDRA